MLRKLTLSLLLMAGSAAAVLAHHGWGSYDASKPITVTGPIETSKYENPHATITVKAADKVKFLQDHKAEIDQFNQDTLSKPMKPGSSFTGTWGIAAEARIGTK